MRVIWEVASFMNKEKIFVMSDIHGEISLMEELLKKWDEEEEQLVILGDLTDRGDGSKEVLELAYRLVQTKDAIILKGNHDDMLENYLKNPDENYGLYYMNGGGKTVDSLLGKKKSAGNYQKNAKKIKKKYPWLLPFLQSFRYFYEWGDYLFVHAGVDLSLANWRDSTPRDFIWIREGFYDQENRTNKTIIFGHTVTSSLHGDRFNHDIWHSGDGLIGIDGGAVYGGMLHALVLSKEKIEEHYSLSSERL